MHRAEQRRQQGARSSAHGWADTSRWRPKAACATDSAPQYTSTRAATRACLTGYSGRGCNNHVVSPLIQCTYMASACVVPVHYVTRLVTSIGQKGGTAKRLEVKTRQGRGFGGSQLSPRHHVDVLSNRVGITPCTTSCGSSVRDA